MFLLSPREIQIQKYCQILVYWTLVFIYAFMIFHLSAQSHPLETMELLQKTNMDKILHIAEYAIFAFLIAKAISISFTRTSAVKMVLAVCVIGVLYAVSDEYHQSFVPCRNSDYFDTVADSVGIMLGAATMWL